MKKFKINNNIFIIILLISIGILSIITYKISYSTPTIKIEEETKIDDESIWNFLENTQEREAIIESSEDELDTELIVESKNETEDPDDVVKKEETKNKGVSKTTTAKKAVAKYETNETSLGIDVSKYQGTIDWKKVKESGISFVMIRCGFRRLNTGEIVMDEYFTDNVKGALANQINVGVYFFSMAKNSKEALEEAKWVVNVIKDYDITYPVAIDTEIFNRYRLKGVSYTTLTNNALVFCTYIKSKGYTPMIYSYKNALTNYFNTAKFNNQRIWLAQYADKATYKGTYHMWQYTSSGSVPGISGRVDMDIAYFSVTNDVTKASTVNGITNTGNLADVPFKDCNVTATINKEITIRISPYTSLPNKAGSLPSKTKVTITGIGTKWIRFEYNNNTFYSDDISSFNIDLEEVTFEETELETTTKEKVTLLSSPYNFLNNEVQTLSENEIVKITGLNENFTRLIYNDTEYYVNSTTFYNIEEQEETSNPEETEQESIEETDN